MLKNILRKNFSFSEIFRLNNFWPRRCLSSGQTISGWTVNEIGHISEFNMTAVKLSHPSGSQLLHIKRPDSNATFSVNFRTVPMESTGLPHILEHTVLCGSERYPCRDPFFNMLNRSLATFMNAMTAPDCTFYPFSSKNPQDWNNLQSVYLDAVFRPNLHKNDFHQEGWRLEHENPEDSTTPIVIKGVVFNEMKGVFSDNQMVYMEALLNGILPSHTYGVCSGGIPVEIPRLTHRDLVDFHKQHYTAGNAKFYIYGDVPLEKHLAAIDPYLSPAGKAAMTVPPEPRWDQPRRKHLNCRPDPMAANPDKQSCISVSYLCCDIKDIQEVFTLTVLSQLLVDGPNAEFYKTLIEPGFGAGLTPSTGFENQLRDTLFSVGLQGVNPADFEKIENTIQETLENAAKTGFPEERIEAILHSIELGTKHQSANFGLSLLFGVTPIWNHDGDIISAFQIEKQVKTFREDLKKDAGFLQKKIKQYFLNQPHRLLLTMSPSDDYELQQKKAEEALLQEKLSTLTASDKERIYKEGLELLESRKLDNKEVLPTLRVSDISENIDKNEKTERVVATVPVTIFPQPTNGVTYFRALLSTGYVDTDLQPYLPVLAHILTKMGTKRRSFKEFDQVMSLYTGGLGAACHVTDRLVTCQGYEGSILIGSHCLDRNVQKMFDLWSEVLEEGDLENNARFETLLKSLAANLINSVQMSGHRYAMLAASALVSPASAQQEVNGGMTYLARLKNLAGNEVESALKIIRDVRKSLSASRLRCAVNTLPTTDLTPLDKFLTRLNQPGGVAAFNDVPRLHNQNVGIMHVLSADVSHAAQVVPTVTYTHSDFPALRILAKYLTSKYLHVEVREKGGAYGGSATLSTSGLFQCFSYRDPSPVNSLRVFDGSYDWLKQNMPTATDIEEAKLGVFQGVDSPVAPGDRGSSWFLHGITDEFLAEHRRRLKAVTSEDLLRVAEKYLTKPAGRCVIGPQNEQIINDDRYKWTTVSS